MSGNLNSNKKLQIMNLILDDKTSLIIKPNIAKVIGLNESIVLQQLHYWTKLNKAKGTDSNKNFKDGYYWSYNSYKKWKITNFPFWSESTIKRIFIELEGLNLVISGNYNDLKIDKTKWYRLDYDNYYDLLMEKLPSDDQPSDQIDPTKVLDESDEETNPTKPIPEINTETISKTNTENLPSPKPKSIQSIRSGIVERSKLSAIDFDKVKIDDVTKKARVRINELRREVVAFDNFHTIREIILRLNTSRRAVIKAMSLQYDTPIEKLFERFEEYNTDPVAYTKWFIKRGYIKSGFSWPYFCSPKFIDSYLASVEMSEGKQPVFDKDESDDSADAISKRYKDWNK